MPDANVPWSVPWASYEPVPFTAKPVTETTRATKPGGWAAPEISGLGPADWKTRISHEGAFVFDEKNRPLNPRGRTGMSDRGLLGKWGCNHAADPVVTLLAPHRQAEAADGCDQAQGRRAVGPARRDGR